MIGERKVFMKFIGIGIAYTQDCKSQENKG
jgi:hypothetical protein